MAAAQASSRAFRPQGFDQYASNRGPTKEQHDAKISTFAIAMIALFFVGSGFLGYGVSSLPQVVITGFSFMYQIVALHFIVIGLVCCAIASIMGLRSLQRCEQKVTPVQIDPSSQNGARSV